MHTYRNIALLLAIMMLLLSGCRQSTPANASFENPMEWDSREIPQEDETVIRETLDETSCQGIIKVYSGYFFSIAERDEDQVIPRIVNNTSSLQYFAYDAEGNIAWYLERDGKLRKEAYDSNFSWDVFCQYAIHPELIFGETIDVYAVYCIQDSRSGSTVYFATERGDYCLHQRKKSNEGIYLVPLEELAAMAQKELAELREEHGDKVPLGFHYVFSNFEGAERFLFNPDDPLGFEKASEDDGNWLSGMWVIVGLAGLMAATVVVVFLPRKKRCKRNRIQGELPTEKNES